MTASPPVPQPKGGPAATWPYRQLYDRVLETLHALPEKFETTLKIEGVPATDLFTMNSALGAAIEKGVVDSLNSLREFWDPDGVYADYRFVRQSQVFPDVLLTTTNLSSTRPQILMGIELKGWFLLSKEGEPSFRYKISPSCCADADLLVVVPWLFESVISGRPRLLAPIVKEARFAAERRNYHWEWERQNRGAQPASSRGVTPALHAGTYPSKSSRASDTAVSDSGQNFGRVARCGVMNEDVDAALNTEILGIPADAWRRFLQIFVDRASPAVISEGVRGLERAFESSALSREQRIATGELLLRLAAILHEADN